MARSPDVAGTPDHLPRPEFHFTGQVGRTFKDSDPAQFPQPTDPPKGAPNIVLILLDDVGFGQFSTFGGGVPSPTMDRLAREGVRYNHFHTTALCSPTRAALITGRNHHSTSFAGITELATGYDGYCCILPKNCGTVAEVLRQNGYMTAWIGKNHNTPTWETSPIGPFDRWANGLGFDYFYGFNAGDMSHWHPVLYENHNLVPASDDPDYHLTEDLADKAIEWMRRSKSIAPDKPFFLYVAPGATHAPHQAPKDWIDKFKGQFDDGWDAYREKTLERQKALGVVPKDTQLTERSKGLPAWDGLNPDQKRLYARMMECFAGYGAQVDEAMGRVVDAVKALPDADNTIILYIAGDNGSSAEGGLEGSLNENLFFQRLPREVAGQPQGHRRAGWPQTLQPLPLVLGPRDEHPVPVDQTGGQPFRRHPQSPHHQLAGRHQGQGRAARPVPARHRHRADPL
jgi:arylsulfatase A-like enzyme